jgi:hypothetical protein
MSVLYLGKYILTCQVIDNIWEHHIQTCFVIGSQVLCGFPRSFQVNAKMVQKVTMAT